MLFGILHHSTTGRPPKAGRDARAVKDGPAVHARSGPPAVPSGPHLARIRPAGIVGLHDAVPKGHCQLARGGVRLQCQDTAAEIRVGIWKTSLSIMADHPLGIGIGNFPRVVGLYDHALRKRSTHNTFIAVFVELGVHETKGIEKLESLDPVPRTMIETSNEDDDASESASDPNDKTLQ